MALRSLFKLRHPNASCPMMSGSARTDAHAQLPANVKVLVSRQITCVFVHTYIIHFVDPT